jgi:hypothetical protein
LWKQYAIVWGSIIAASQVTDALKDVFPFTKKHKAERSNLPDRIAVKTSIFAQAEYEAREYFRVTYGAQ